jgi:stage V sporulation protein B
VIGLAGYGALSRVLAVASVVTNVVVASSIQGVSRTVSRARGVEAQALRATLRVHAPLALLLALGFAACAPLVARFEEAPHITAPLVAEGGVVLLYGIYAPLIGMLNGRRQFTRQASLDMVFAVLRTAGLLGVGWLFVQSGGSGALGAIVGFVIAAACIVPLAARFTGFGAAPASDLVPGPAAYLAQLVPLALAQLGTNLLMQVDITILGRFLSKAASLRLSPELAAKSADEWVAVYRACQLFAFLPYQLLFSVTQVLFPMVARAKAEGDDAAVARYVARGARIAMIACGIMVSVIVAAPRALLDFAYGPIVAERGAEALRVLALGQGAFAMLGVATTVLASLGRERAAAWITAVSCGGVALAVYLGMPFDVFGRMQLVSTATATSVALGFALAAGAVAVRAVARAFVPPKTFARVAVAIVVAYVSGAHLPHVGKLGALGLAMAIAALYLAFLIASRELTGADAAELRALVARRRA